MSSYHIVLLGDGGVGKSCLTIQITSNTFVEEYDPSIEDIYRKQIVVDDVMCLLEILDTGGRDPFSFMRDESIRKAAGFVIVYSITSLSSFEQLEIFINQVHRVAPAETHALMIIAGNKMDLDDKREVATEKGIQLASSYGLSFFETSAKTRRNVQEVFFELIRKIRKQLLRTKPKKKSCLIL